jgi:simple sugar transport system permease protein
LPYLGTLVLLIVPVVASARIRRLMAAPAALGIPYFRDER